jgi:type IV secretory pathway component VirB8
LKGIFRPGGRGSRPPGPALGLGDAASVRAPVAVESSDGAAGGDEDGGGDRLGAWFRRHRTGDPSRADKRALRFMTFNAALGWLTALVLANAVADLVPLRRDVPYLMQVASGERQVADVAPLKVGVAREKTIAETMALEYVKVRHEVVPDAAEMNRRWGRSCLKNRIHVEERLCGYMAKHSADDVYREFFEQNVKAVQTLIEEGIDRRIRVDLAPIERGEGFYEIRFTMTDSKPGKDGLPETVRQLRYVASIWYEFRAEETVLEERYLNPFGFRVIRYRLAERQEPKDGQKEEGK